MSAGITRVHSSPLLPSQRPSAVQFFNLTIANNLVSMASDITTAGGALDTIFRTALPQFATVAMIGTMTTSGANNIINFAIEATGIDLLSPSGLGSGSSENSSNWSSGPAYSSTSTAYALQLAVASLGTVNGINLATSATVAVGVAAVGASANSVYGL